ncbi:MAG: Flp pilus assembly complex ATPase component TadA [Algicola sp.]|nr:Flp pilus assembly complex ATPase component TadA [Algicola sp.]
MVDMRSLLCQHFSVSDVDYEKAIAYQSKYSGRIERILVNMGALAEDKLHLVYQQFLDIPLFEGAGIEANAENVQQVIGHDDHSWLKDKGWLVIDAIDNDWTFVSVDPLEMSVNQWVGQKDIDPTIYIATTGEFEQLAIVVIEHSEDLFANDLTSIEEAKLRELAAEAPIVSLLNSLITRALRDNASDMHIEPIDNKCRVRFRVDGVLHAEEYIPTSMELPIVTRIKILSGMDIAEKRRPQDGKIELKIAQEELDVRVSALPLNLGESVVMRFLRKDTLSYDMTHLGLAEDVQRKIDQDLQSTSGVILLTGPTGSGKTTSLYTFLSALNSDKVKIITLEDPVEYQLDGVNQVQVKPDIGFDFAAGLRSIVRQDPDIIMLGEIRDHETARIAMQSAITGHLVFSTVHTNDAPSAYTRLLDLGVEEFLLNAALVSIIAQRLLRTLCDECSQPLDAAQVHDMLTKYPMEKLAEQFTQGNINLRKPKGCDSCNHTGYKGRKAIVEYMPCDEVVRSIPKDSFFIDKVKKYNAEQNNRTMLEDGLLKVIQGMTTIDEVMRVAG